MCSSVTGDVEQTGEAQEETVVMGMKEMRQSSINKESVRSREPEYDRLQLCYMHSLSGWTGICSVNELGVDVNNVLRTKSKPIQVL